MHLHAVKERILLQFLLSEKRLSGTLVKVYLCIYHRPVSSTVEHAKHWGIPRETFRRAVRDLIDLGWIVPLPEHKRGRRVVAWMPYHVEEAVVTELNRVRENVAYLGEWLMRCLLDLMVDEKHFVDNARPPWLVSGDGGGRMELDRWYSSSAVAFEFQGAQHYRAGDISSEIELAGQRARDNLKAGICSRTGVRLVEITAYDLSIQGLRQKIGALLPMFPVFENRPICRALTQMCHAYANQIARQVQRHSVQA